MQPFLAVVLHVVVFNELVDNTISVNSQTDVDVIDIIKEHKMPQSCTLQYAGVNWGCTRCFTSDYYPLLQPG